MKRILAVTLALIGVACGRDDEKSQPEPQEEKELEASSYEVVNPGRPDELGAPRFVRAGNDYLVMSYTTLYAVSFTGAMNVVYQCGEPIRCALHNVRADGDTISVVRSNRGVSSEDEFSSTLVRFDRRTPGEVIEIDLPSWLYRERAGDKAVFDGNYVYGLGSMGVEGDRVFRPTLWRTSLDGSTTDIIRREPGIGGDFVIAGGKAYGSADLGVREVDLTSGATRTHLENLGKVAVIGLQANRLWVATQHGGVYAYDYATDAQHTILEPFDMFAGVAFDGSGSMLAVVHQGRFELYDLHGDDPATLRLWLDREAIYAETGLYPLFSATLASAEDVTVVLGAFSPSRIGLLRAPLP